MKLKAINSIDFYKSGHIIQYPEGTEMVYSNFTPRSNKHSNIKNGDGVVFFGLQGFIKWYLQDCWNDTFFNREKEEVVGEYKRRMDNALGPDSIDVRHIEELHDLGYLPIKIKALPEGVTVPYGVPVFTIKNTDPKFFWITNYLESVMSAELWKSCTSATTAKAYRQEFERHAAETGSPVDFIMWQGHDFSFRGMGGVFDSMSSGAGHLTAFSGTDTVSAIDFMEEYYGADSDKELVGGSVPATEHSVMCMGTFEDELGTFKRLINDLYPSGLVSIVSDTWDFWKVITEFLPTLKEDIMSREGRVVIRPDSGDPVDIICGTLQDVKEVTAEECPDRYTLDRYLEDYLLDLVGDETPHGEHGATERSEIIMWKDKYYEATITNISWNRHDKQYYYIDMWEAAKINLKEIELTSEMKGAYQCLYETFGGTINDKGFKELDGHVGLIYGDSITLDRQKEILKRLEKKGFTASNLVLGIGSYTYTYVTRDTHGFAMKATYGIVDGEGREIFKDPKTDSGLKKSAKGLLRVDLVDGIYVLTDQVSPEEEEKGELITVFEDGNMVTEYTLADIRARVAG